MPALVVENTHTVKAILIPRFAMLFCYPTGAPSQNARGIYVLNRSIS